MDAQNDQGKERAFDRATTTQQDASRIGFDWPDVSGVLDKVAEELEEVRDALRQGDVSHARTELGDLLFAAVSVARFLHVNPEKALDDATDRFEARMSLVRQIAREQGISLQSCAADALDVLWEQAKRLMRQQLEKDLDNVHSDEAD